MSEDWKSREPDRDQLERHLDHELKKRGMTRRDAHEGRRRRWPAALGLGALVRRVRRRGRRRGAECAGGGE